MTRESSKINFDPHSTSTRQEILKSEACILKSDRETRNFDQESLVYAQTQVSCIRASIAMGMARKQIDETTKKVFRLKLDFDERLINPIRNFSTKSSFLKETHSLKNIAWVMETNMLKNLSTTGQQPQRRNTLNTQSPLLNQGFPPSEHDFSAFSRSES